MSFYFEKIDFVYYVTEVTTRLTVQETSLTPLLGGSDCMQADALLCTERKEIGHTHLRQGSCNTTQSHVSCTYSSDDFPNKKSSVVKVKQYYYYYYYYYY